MIPGLLIVFGYLATYFGDNMADRDKVHTSRVGFWFYEKAYTICWCVRHPVRFWKLLRP